MEVIETTSSDAVVLGAVPGSLAVSRRVEIATAYDSGRAKILVGGGLARTMSPETA